MTNVAAIKIEYEKKYNYEKLKLKEIIKKIKNTTKNIIFFKGNESNEDGSDTWTYLQEYDFSDIDGSKDENPDDNEDN